VAEPFHALTYFAPESHEAFEAAGLRGFWRGYFGGRAAPMGAVTAGTVTMTFFGFHPDFVARAIPSIWSLVDPRDAIAARLEGIDRATHRIFGSDFPESDASRAAAEVQKAAERCPVAGRPLFGANIDLVWPTTPALALWHAATLVREHRGDGHVGALVDAGIDPCEAHVLRIADESLPIDSIQPYRGWSDADWAAAANRLRERGWLDNEGSTTPEGHDTRQAVEAETDRLSAALVDRIENPTLVLEVLELIARALEIAAEIPYPNPIGVPPVAPG
jgi:hypothetical protein